MKISKTQIKQIIEEELDAVLSENELEEVNLAALNLMRRMQKKRQRGPGASSVDTHKRALAAKEKTQAQRDKERKDKEEKERKEYDRRWRASLSPEDEVRACKVENGKLNNILDVFEHALGALEGPLAHRD